MTYGTHLRRSRHGTLYFRFVVPADLRGRAGKTELSISLGTSSRRSAELAALELRLAAKRFVEDAREAAQMTDSRKPNPGAFHAMVEAQRRKGLLRELDEADRDIAEKQEQIDRLTRKLIATIGAPQPAAATSAGPTLSAAVKAFQAERAATGKWTPKTEEMLGTRLRLLLEWFGGDVPVSSLTREGLTAFLVALKRLPKNASKHKALNGLTMRQLVEAEGFARIAPTTCNQVLQHVTSLFAWMASDGAKWKVTGNLAKGLTIAKAERVKRVAFSDDDLRAMFTQPEWTARQFLHSYSYWLLPLALFTGARVNELCQAELKDFGVEHGHPVLSLCVEGGRAKSKSARRKVPIHPELVRLGLLRHVERLRKAGEVRLFPECVERRDGHGADASRWFSKFRTRAGITDPRRVLHSTRHGFATQLLDAGIDERQFAPLIGHAGGGESSTSYWNSKDVRQFVAMVNIVSYPVVTELVPVVEDVRFGVDVHRKNRRPPPRKPAAAAAAAKAVRGSGRSKTPDRPRTNDRRLGKG